MNLDPPSEAVPGVFAPRAAFFLGLALLLAMALVLSLTTLDRNHRASDETHEEVTAVGDSSFYNPPAVPSKISEPAILLHGKPCFLVNKRITNRDSNMIQVSRDDSGTYWIYTDRVPGKTSPPEAMRKTGLPYYLKVALDEYLEVRVQK